MKLTLSFYLMLGVVLCLSLNSRILQAQEIGQQAPTLVLPDINGQASDLASLKGNYVYLHFWASWCPNSSLQLPLITELHDYYKDKNFKIYSVSLDASRDAWLNAIDNYQLVWPQHQCDFRGPFSHNLDDYNFIGTPFGYLISPSGVILEVDPDVHEYVNWFNTSEKQGNYYTVHLGTFSNLAFVDFEYIEEIDGVESGYENGSYYVHLGKYANPVEAENSLRQALNKGYHEATVVTDTYNGETGLEYVDPFKRNLNNTKTYYPNTSPFSSNTDTYYDPFSPAPSLSDNSEISKNTPAPNTTPNSSNNNAPSFSHVAPKEKEVKKEPIPQKPDFYTPPNFNEPKGDVSFELPDETINPNSNDFYQEHNNQKDLFKKLNPYLDYAPGETVDERLKSENNIEPLAPPPLPESFYESETENSINEYSNSYSDKNPFDDVYEEDKSDVSYGGYDSTLPQKESKYQRKLRIKKEKAKRKQDKLKKEMEATMKEIKDIEESIEFSRSYPND